MPHHPRLSLTQFANSTADGVLASWGVESLGDSAGVVLETVEGHLGILADLDEIAVGITRVAAPFRAVIV